MPGDYWYNSYSKIVAFGKVLHKAGIIETQDDIFDYFNQPSVYDPAYEKWVELGNPQPRDKEWKEFKDSIQVTVEGDDEEDDEEKE